MAGLVAWALATFWPPPIIQRQNKYKIPLPKQCHMSVRPDKLDSRSVFVVGDVHGCFEELCQLLQLAATKQDNPFIIFVGDMINKGPQNIDVLRLVRHMVENGQAAAVRGNHEESILRELWALSNNGNYTLPDRYRWLHELSEEDCCFLQELPYTISLPSLGALIVHAGLVPGLPLTRQSLESLTHMRNIIQEDYFSGRGLVGVSKTDQGLAWASLWPGPEQVYFGHDARRGLQSWPYAMGLDTGCLYGGRLTGVFVGDEREVLSVPALSVYVQT